MSPARWRLRTAVLLLAGALSVHELRYALSPLPDSHALATRHGYLLVLIPLAGMLMALVLGRLLLRVGGVPSATGGGRLTDQGRSASRWRLWAAVSLALIALFVTQESLEALLSEGGRGVLALIGIGPSPEPSLLAGGGWLLLPLAAATGALVTLGLGAVSAELAPVVEHPRARLARLSSGVLSWALHSVEPRLRGVLAQHLAGRAPPLASTL